MSHPRDHPLRAIVLGEHLAPEELAAYIDGTLDPANAAVAREHLAECAECRAEIEDLRQFAATMHAERTGNYGLWVAVAATVLLFVAAVLVTMRRTSPGIPASEALIHLRDGSRRVTLAPSGAVRAIDYGRADWNEAVTNVLRSGVLRLPQPVAQQLDPLRGPERDRLRLYEPIGIAVATTRPLLRWEALPDATYDITVADEEGNVIASAPAVAEPRWRVTSELRYGGRYTWQVRTAGRLRSRPAQFHVIAEAEWRDIEAARKEGSHLLAAVLLARAGAPVEADEELSQFKANNRDQAVAQRLTAR
jgi:hypothetical protein